MKYRVLDDYKIIGGSRFLVVALCSDTGSDRFDICYTQNLNKACQIAEALNKKDNKIINDEYKGIRFRRTIDGKWFMDGFICPIQIPIRHCETIEEEVYLVKQTMDTLCVQYKTSKYRCIDNYKGIEYYKDEAGGWKIGDGEINKVFSKYLTDVEQLYLIQTSYGQLPENLEQESKIMRLGIDRYFGRTCT